MNEDYIRELMGDYGVPDWVIEQIASELDQRDAKIAELLDKVADFTSEG